MSDQPEQDSKTEAPTERRILESIEKGNTPFSREVVSLGSLLSMLACIALAFPQAANELTKLFSAQLAASGEKSIETPSAFAAFFADTIASVGLIVAPSLILLAVGGMIGSLVQNTPSASASRIAPKWERLSPKKNIKRILGSEGFIEFGKTSIKFLALCLVVYHVLKESISDLVNIGVGDPSQISSVLWRACQSILIPITLFVLFLAVLDVVWTRLKWWNDLKMTRQEMQDEHKNSEGDPRFKEHRRQLARRNVRSRMMADLPRATIVVTNPTHFAVAMRYVASEGGAPVVVAKGVDFLALRIRETCAEHRIPVVEDRPLARALYGSCEVGQMIPPEHYRAVAEILHFVEMKRQLSQRKNRQPRMM